MKSCDFVLLSTSSDGYTGGTVQIRVIFPDFGGFSGWLSATTGSEILTVGEPGGLNFRSLSPIGISGVGVLELLVIFPLLPERRVSEIFFSRSY